MTLQQATLVGAEIIGMSGRLGVLRAGAIADILVVDGNPCMSYAQHIVMPWFHCFEVERPEQFGGNK